MTAKGRLRRYFLGPAIALNLGRVADPSFRKALIQLFTELDARILVETWPVVSKDSKVNKI
jgi:hypothetical protein